MCNFRKCAGADNYAIADLAKRAKVVKASGAKLD